MQEEQGQKPVELSYATQSVTERSNDMEIHIGGTSVGEEKAGPRADSVQSIKNRTF